MNPGIEPLSQPKTILKINKENNVLLLYLSESYFWGYLKLSKIKYSEGRIDLYISICQLADRQQNNGPTAANNCAYTALMHYSWEKLHKVTDYGNLSNLVTEKFGFHKIVKKFWVARLIKLPRAEVKL